MGDGSAAAELLRKINSLDPSIFNIDFKDLENTQEIGGGNFGQVSRGTYFGTEVAIKQLLDVDDKDMHKYIEREMSTLRDMRHPNVVQFMGLCRHGIDIFIVTEYIPGGDLRHILKQEDKEMPWLLRARIACDVAQAMTFLHSKGLIHRDLKSNNLLVGDNWKIKVCDFGFSRRVNPGEQMTLCGTDEWMAPEVMCGDKYDEKADVFSYGMVLTELVTRKKPPLRKPAKQFRFEVEPFRAAAPPGTPPLMIELAIQCSAHLPADRPPFRDILHVCQKLVVELQEAEQKRLAAAQAAAAAAAQEKSEPRKKKKATKVGPDGKSVKEKRKEKRPDETPEEKAKRREDRRRRKAEKAAKEAAAGGTPGAEAEKKKKKSTDENGKPKHVKKKEETTPAK